MVHSGLKAKEALVRKNAQLDLLGVRFTITLADLERWKEVSTGVVKETVVGGDGKEGMGRIAEECNDIR